MPVVYGKSDMWIDHLTMIRRGEIWKADDPIVAQFPQHFTSDPAEFARSSSSQSTTSGAPGHVEQATAAPGEHRSIAGTGTVPAAGRTAARRRG